MSTKSKKTGRIKISQEERRRIADEKNKKSFIRSAIAAGVFVVVLLGIIMLVTSGVLGRSLPAASASGVRFTANEFNYFYYTAYSELTNFLGSVQGETEGILPNPAIPFGKQVFDSSTGRTWEDVLAAAAMDKLSSTAAIYSAAKAAGFALSPQQQVLCEFEVDELKRNVERSDYASLDNYLRSSYGKFMTEKSYRQLAEILAICEAYKEEVSNGFTFSQDELSSYYNERRDKLDMFTYRYIHVRGETVLRSDFAEDADYALARTQAAEAVAPQAELIYSKIVDEDSFIAQAEEYNPGSYSAKDSTLRTYRGEELGDIYGSFLRENGREYGETTLVPMPTGYYIVFFIDRFEAEDMLEMADERMRRDRLDQWLAELPTENVRRGIAYSLIG